MNQKIETFELTVDSVPTKQKTAVTQKSPVQALVEDVS